ncbi:hypothetical protein [Allofustis seminis]|uniref:hypothetical protein n=1 Tax=Allofustis seminis TaxID=166939 RepID=UPI0003811389|nr:hypothetical protein [Allofustis seminis]
MKKYIQIYVLPIVVAAGLVLWITSLAMNSQEVSDFSASSEVQTQKAVAAPVESLTSTKYSASIPTHTLPIKTQPQMAIMAHYSRFHACSIILLLAVALFFAWDNASALALSTSAQTEHK